MIPHRRTADHPRTPGPRRWIPLLALLPLIALMLADVVMATLAIRSDPGLVADAPRRVGMARLAPGEGLALQLALRPLGPGVQELRLRLAAPDGAPVPEALVEGRLGRATHAGADRPLHFARDAAGEWVAEIRLPDAGAWQVSVAARDGSGRSGVAVARLGP